MKIHIAAVLSIGLIAPLPFQAQGQLLSAETYQITERGPHHSVWEKEEVVILPAGGEQRITHRYTELASGLNYLNESGQWQRSVEEFEITKDGYAVAQRGQHRVIISPVLNDAEGAVDLLTPDGKRMRSTLMGLSLFNRINGDNLLIAEVTRSVGKQIAPNTILFEDCFDDIHADVRMTYERGAFHQDVILREAINPKWLDANGFLPETTSLEIWTEFISTEDPKVSRRVVAGFESPEVRSLMVEPDIVEEDLDFGHMKMPMGVAYAQGNPDDLEEAINVPKRWVKNEEGTFLVESISLADLQPLFGSLPRWSPEEGEGTRVKHAQRRAPAPILVSPKSETIQTASLNREQEPGVVLDYTTVSGSLTDKVFEGCETYYLSGTTYCYGDSVIEGGAVFKFPSTGGVQFRFHGSVDCQTAPYRPAIFTAKDDDSVGATISGSSGNPSPSVDYGTFGLFYYNSSDDADLHDLRFRFQRYGLHLAVAGDHVVRHCQFVHNDYGLYAYNTTVTAQNLLFHDMVYYAMVSAGSSTIRAEHLTVHDALRAWAGNTLYLTNSLLVDVTVIDDTFTSVNNITNSSSSVFTTVGAGDHYLADNTYRNAGNTNISILEQLKQRTTYPPLVYSNVTSTVDVTLWPQAQRDTDIPDLGYHYDPLDYITHKYVIDDATVTLTNGVAVASYNDTGIQLEDGSAIVSVGAPTTLNRLVRYTSVQEQPVDYGSGVSVGLTISSYHTSTPDPTGEFRFTEFACPANGGYHFYNTGSWAYDTLDIQHCFFWNGDNTINSTDAGTADIQNCLFHRLKLECTSASSSSVTFSNNLMFDVTLTTFQATNWKLHDNAFEACTFSTPLSTLANSHNGYINCAATLPSSGGGDKTLSSLAWESGALGDWYQPSSSTLINAGSDDADDVGLYHYTVRTTQAKETTSQLDIGLHYVAVDDDGVPLDDDGDGLPDYLEDANGNGTYNSGSETDWQTSENGTSDGSGRLQVFTPFE